MSQRTRKYPKLERIAPRGQPYLDRYVIARIGRLQIYLHKWYGQDPEEHYHDHRWIGLFWIVRGGYQEIRVTPSGQEHCHWRGIFNFIRPRTIHRISHTQPNTVTLGVMFRVRKYWHFYRKSGAIYVVDGTNQ